MRKVRIAIISGYTQPYIFDKIDETRKMGSPYGPSPLISIGKIDKETVAFLPRHGEAHTNPPHKINYRANIWALHTLGVERIVAINFVGAMNESMQPGDVVIPHDIIDFTKMRVSSFYDEPPVTHIDVTQPYCPQLRDILIKVASKSLTKFWDKAVQVCVEGPRFETPAEITMFKILGGDIVGMTSSPEVFLAKELGICYASLSVISNFAAGLQNKISAEEVLKTSSKTKSTICQLIRDAVRTIPERRSCGCASSLEGARI